MVTRYVPSCTFIFFFASKTHPQCTVLHLPWTKAGKEQGEDIQWSAMPSSKCDPNWAMQNHLCINSPADGKHLFTHFQAKWQTRTSTHWPMTFSIFNKHLKTVVKAANVDIPPAHGFCIGGTTEWLLRGLPFEVVKTLGWWSSDAFCLYL
jgi:hypothetical protein